MIYLYGLYAVLAFALAGWLLSLATRQYSHVDSMWSLFMLIVACTTLIFLRDWSTRSLLVFAAVTVWSVRLSLFITWRNWGHEDHRYLTIAHNNAPHFWFKSVYLVFVFQAVLAWLIAYPVYVSLNSHTPLNLMDGLACLLWLIGFYWEVVADWQLARFKADAHNHTAVCQQGLWRYSRHPNYFGECLIWWSFALFALASGNMLGLFSAVLMTLLLLKVSGVALLEKTIQTRRPAYAQYVATTNAFIPGRPRHLK